ncbi:MAG: hypothetical protein GF381_03045 [Candidatus Pacebacteria bacterium]|nr:hypothetical protein [Candidatus Paceibacterota bacterium]
MKQTQTSNQTSGQALTPTLLEKFSTWLMLGLILLLPVLAIPLTNGFVAQTKLFLLIWGALFVLVLFLVKSFQKKSWQLVVSPLTLPLLAFGLVVLASVFFTQAYPVKSLLGLGGAYLGAIIFTLVGPSLISRAKIKWLVPLMATAGSVLTIASLLQLAGIGPSRFYELVLNAPLPQGLMFNLAGSSLVAAQVILLGLIGLIARLLISKKLTTFETIAIPFLTLGLGLHIWSLLPGQETSLILAPFAASWSVVLDSLEIPRAALIGQGPEGYLTTFARYKPGWLNTDSYWRISFSSAAGYPLTLLVQLGVLGLLIWVWLLVKLFLTFKNKKAIWHSPLSWLLVISLILQLVFPPNYILIGLQGLVVAFWTAQFSSQFSLLKLKPLSAKLVTTNQTAGSGKKTKPADSSLSLVMTSALIVMVLGLFYLSGRAYASFYQLLKADQALLENKGVQVYEHQRRAVNLNPYLDSTRRTYALTNLQVATALSNKADATDQEKQQVAQLIRQAVREGRAATTIDPTDYRNWTALAQVYNQLIGSVQEADQWAVNAYVNAIKNYPTSPTLRIELGSLLLKQEEREQAANLFAQAINLKPDLPAGYFHLGLAQRTAGNLTGAKNAWIQALNLLETQESEEATQLQNLLKELEQEIKRASNSGQTANQADSGSGSNRQEQIDPETELTPLGKEVPSLTDQNLEELDESLVGNPETKPLELSPESQEAVNQTTE